MAGKLTKAELRLAAELACLEPSCSWQRAELNRTEERAYLGLWMRDLAEEIYVPGYSHRIVLTPAGRAALQKEAGS